MSNLEDPYKGQRPEYIWTPLSSDIGGLRQLTADTPEKRENYWTIIEPWLKTCGVGERLKGKRVIEIGPGNNIDFRDFCVEYEASEYIGIDLFHFPASPPSVLGKTQIRYYRKDIFQFLETEASDSAVIAGFIVFCDELIHRKRCENLGIRPDDIIRRTALEIYRVLIPGEHLIAMSLGDLFLKYLLEAGFIRENSSLFLKP